MGVDKVLPTKYIADPSIYLKDKTRMATDWTIRRIRLSVLVVFVL